MIYVLFFLGAIAITLLIISLSRRRTEFLAFFSGLVFIIMGLAWFTTEVTPTIERGSSLYAPIGLVLIFLGIVCMVISVSRQLTLRRKTEDGEEESHGWEFPQFLHDTFDSPETKQRKVRAKRQANLDAYQARIHRALNPPSKPPTPREEFRRMPSLRRRK